MSSILQLPEAVYARIAAGEVIVNPAAAVKELLENAIDAGATGITVEIEDGGRSLIRVTDNGSGIAEDELPMAVKRHATSKIRAFDDLYSLTSLGFRGEALASMAEVSRFTLSSRKAGTDSGARLTVDGGSPPRIEPAGLPEGTTVRVEDLFYNVPARRKFLKTAAREGTLISETVRRAILSRPDVAFKYVRNGRVAYQSSGNGKLRDAIAGVYGPDSLRELQDVQWSADGTEISGCVSRPSYIFRSAQRIDFFVNGRYIQSKTLQKALMSGYGESLLRGHYPLAVLALRVSPELLDINVHPAKLTAMFYDEDVLLGQVTRAVSQAVSGSTGAPYVPIQSPELREGREPKSAAPAPEFWVTVPRKSPPQQGPLPAASPQVESDRSSTPLLQKKESPTGPGEEQTSFLSGSAAAPQMEEKDGTARGRADTFARMVEAPDEEPQSEEEEMDVRSVQSSRILGSAFATYIVCEANGRLFFVDQHAARERLTYESMVAWAKNGEKHAQMLLIPLVRTFPAPEFAVLTENAQLLEQLGLTFEEFGEMTLRFFSLPVQMGADDVDAFLVDVVEELRTHPNDPIIARDHLIASACRHSVKGGTEITEEEMKSLLREISQMQSIPFCPHGRPIAVEITREQLERGFRRRV